MRIRFFSPGDEAETGFLLVQLAAIDEFWKRFRRVSAQAEASWLPTLRAELAHISPALGLEVRHEREGARVLYIVPLEGSTDLQLARALVERAPSVWPWSFSVHRPSLPLGQVLAIVRQDFQLDLGHARVRVGVGRGHLLDVVVGSHLFTGSTDEVALDAADRLVNGLLGDELYEQWIDSVSVVPTPRPSLLRVVGQEETTLTLALSELAPAVVAARRGILAGLPEAPCHAFCEHAEWVLFELEDIRSVQASAAGVDARPARDPAEETVEYPQADLLMTTTMCPEMLRCFLSGSPFASQRFSRHGETFCYLKLTLDGATSDERVARRIAIEESLDHVLVPGGLGCVVGSGIGTQHAYVDLALQRLDASLAVVVRKLREAGVGRNSWILFCDSDLAAEWVGVWDETPAPGWPSTHSSTFGDVYN